MIVGGLYSFLCLLCQLKRTFFFCVTVLFHMAKKARARPRILRWAAFFAIALFALVLAGILDAELGDQHSDVSQRSSLGLSIYISMIDISAWHSAAVSSLGLLVIVGYQLLKTEGLRSICIALCSAVCIFQMMVVLPIWLSLHKQVAMTKRPAHGRVTAASIEVESWNFRNQNASTFPWPPTALETLHNHTTKMPPARPTRQQELASGYTYFENIYYANRTFLLVRGLATDTVKWALMSQAESMQRWGEPGRYASKEERGFGSRRVHLDSPELVHASASLSLRPSIMISDFLPRLTPHLYHMLENLLGIWATSQMFMINRAGHPIEPALMLLPQNSFSEFSHATLSLVGALFPGIRFIDRKGFSQLFDGHLVHFSRLVASDRSAADHGGVNQMITGIHYDLPPFMTSFTSTILKNAGASPACMSSDKVTLTFIDRQHSSNRRLSAGLSKELLWRLGTAHPRLLVHWVQLQHLPFHQQVLRAAESHILLGVHGNGLSHVLFMRKPGALIEIFPERNRLLAYQQFAEARGVLYYGIESSSGVVYREKSCSGHRIEYNHRLRWLPPANCTIRDATINSIVSHLDVAFLVKLVRAAVINLDL